MSAAVRAVEENGARPTGELGGMEVLRLRLSAAVTRLRRWEFWPSWVVYAPLFPYLALLAIKHGSLRVCTRANPGIPHGGIVGESKWDILLRLPQEWIVPTALIVPGSREQRLDALESAMRVGGWMWPIVLKPDVGERGRGVSVIGDPGAAEAYLLAHPDAVLAQRHHPGPFEAGVFYYRFPDSDHGRIFSITDKKFASVVGDGVSSLRALVLRHPRYRVQSPAFLVQLGADADAIPAAGRSVLIGAIGNHCRGTMFLDGAHLITQELERAFDAIALRTAGFYFGRFDVRYADPGEFASGRGFQILELNGLLSESTNVYDPSISFWAAQRVLREQWKIAFAIGAANERLAQQRRHQARREA